MLQFEHLFRDGVVKNYGELARQGQETRVRITQIMNLLNLAPEIQEQVLLMNPVLEGKDSMTERQPRRIVEVNEWGQQSRRIFKT